MNVALIKADKSFPFMELIYIPVCERETNVQIDKYTNFQLVIYTVDKNNVS